MRVTFSLIRCGKKIIWEQSKRLISGSLVVLTPSNDMFSTKAIVATVAARPLTGLQQNPPEIDLFFARPEELQVDPAVEYVMIEDRGGLFEADRHTLTALQHMMKEVRNSLSAFASSTTDWCTAVSPDGTPRRCTAKRTDSEIRTGAAKN